MPFSVSLIIILSISFLFSKLARRFHFSEVIGLIVAGLLLTLPGVKDFTIAGHQETVSMIGSIGLLALMFLSGFEVSGNMLHKEENDAAVITLATFITSLFLGSAVMLFLGYSPETSLVMGTCFGITAEATKGRALIQLKKLKTKIGALLMGTGIINDMIGVLFFVCILYFFTQDFIIQEVIILIEVIAAFMAGIGIHYFFDRFSQKVKIIEKSLLYGVVPFFFVAMGQNFNLGFSQINLKLLLIVFLTASAGQMLGVFFTRPITKLSWRQLYLVGWGMNSRGAVELAIAFIAFRVGLLSASLYSALVITALVGTILFQTEIFRLTRKYPRIMK